MEAAITTANPASGAENARYSTRGRSNRGRGRGRGRGNSSLAFRPASVAPQAHSSDSTSNHEHAPRDQRQGGRGRNGHPRGPRERHPQARTVGGRQFGGQLTGEGESGLQSAQPAGQLQASAPVFIPGSQHVQNVAVSRPKANRQQRPRQPRQQGPKSQAPDIATRTHEDIDNGHYECAICTSEVQRDSKVWSCQTCWAVFHLHCVKAWSASSIKQQEERNGQGSQQPQWRCPACNLPKDHLPKSYTCWCSKEYDPKALPGIPPHSCGQSCGKERPRKCPHPCQLTCHAGPCPPCSHMGPTQSCFCGKHETTKRCTETEYTNGWSCGDVCGSPLGCGDHICPRPCHEGPCGSCQVRLPARCYCGKMEKDVLCGDRGVSRQSIQTHLLENGEIVQESWNGIFDCEQMCDRTFDCGVHTCQKSCHPREANPGHCPRAPDVVTHCGCGKTFLEELSSTPRLTCEDPIPSCDKPCHKTLRCGHLCQRICHTGDCGMCHEVMEISCRCGRTTSNTLCHQGEIEQPQCRRICRTNLNCGRHACEEHCCSGERKAVERLAIKRKQRPLHTASRPIEEGFEAEHICTRQCGRPLKCGNHVCEELCHKGPCGTCREAIFEEIACHCSRTVLMPPLPCGTKPPQCRHPCQRPKPCGHPQMAHNCHQDDENCPRCPFLVERRCMCGKKSLKNQQCWHNDVSCGQVCGRRLKCGSHFCRKPCHRAGECEDANGQICQQPCGKEKKACGHPDEAPCHAPYPCKEDKPCTSKIFITCECQAQKQEIKCNASNHSEGNASKILPCNDECARLERNRKLALALNIDQATHVDGGDHIPFSNETLSLFASQTKWATEQEREFRVFAAANDEKRLRFRPMSPTQRAFIHALAEDFGLDSESVDPEPHRHVMIWKTPRFVSAPNKTLADSFRLRQQAQRSVNASANVSDTEGTKAAKPKAIVVSNEPFNSFVIKNPRFALTLEEVRTELKAVLPESAPFTFDIEFLPSEEVVLKAATRTLSPQDLEKALQDIRSPLTKAIASKGYGNTQLCSTDSSLNIKRLESDVSGGDGWSRVAAKKIAPRTLAPSTGIPGTNSFAALGGGKVTFAKKKPSKVVKPKPEAVVDDWEAAELAEEAKEQHTSASASEDENAAVAEPLGNLADSSVVSSDEASHYAQAPEVSERQDGSALVEEAEMATSP